MTIDDMSQAQDRDHGMVSRLVRRVTAAGVAGLACVASTLTAAPAASARPAAKVGDVQKAMAEIAKADGAVGVIGEAYVDGKRVGRGSAGSRLIDGKGGRIPSGSAYRIWSQTKAMTGAVLLQLVDEGRLELDDKLSEALPTVVQQDLVERADEITIEQLLDHTSGIPDYTGQPELNPFQFTTAYTPVDLLQVSRRQPRTQEPGETFSYSNTNYILLALIVERLTGNSLDRELDERLFEPLGMRRTSLPTKPWQGIRGPHGHGYMPQPDGTLRDVHRMNPTTLWAAGGVISTARDMSTFYRALARGKLLPPHLQERVRWASDVCGGNVRAGRGSGPGSIAMTFSSTDGRRQLAITVTVSVRNPHALQDAIEQQAEAVLCPAR